MAKKQEVWTRQCSDGRACSGFHGAPRFIPDDVDVCDDCLAAQFGLEEVHDSCCCGNYSEMVGYSTKTVLRALRSGLQRRRYYVGMRHEHGVTYTGVYDGDQPRPREPLEEKLWAEAGAPVWAHKRAAKLNGEAVN